MLRGFERLVNSVPPTDTPETPASMRTRLEPSQGTGTAPRAGAVLAVPARRRLGVAERESQIVEAAVRFFAERGLDGQLRDLARDVGITHALLYHYFPTKQALIDRVYQAVCEGRWNPAWEVMLDDPKLSPEDKLVRFYCEYRRANFQRDWIRIFTHSWLSDRAIPDRFFALLREKLFPRLVRETRRHCGVSSRTRPSERELELLMGLHGGIFFIGMRRWVCEEAAHGTGPALHDEVVVTDRVRAYLSHAREMLLATPPAARPRAAPRRGAAAAKP
jgi:AcrR family transcriptional regulator